MGEKYLLDTNTIIYYINGSLPPATMDFINSINWNISFISKIETLVGNKISGDELNLIQAFLNQSNIIGIDDFIINKTIEIRKTNKIKIPDAIIAATALTRNMTLLSRNESDFQKIDALTLINPHK